jgi:bifunctional UDP-N-acetylglucosamine pyrophosphorylase/glucosamine-1-phosphate N-acetyltransferase
MDGVILAAGHGSRLGPIAPFPKPLLPVGDRTILAYQLSQLSELGVRRLILVTGQGGDELAAEARRLAPAMRIVRVVQKRRRGTAHAVAALRGKVRSPFALFLGDIYAEAVELRALRARFDRGDVAAVLAARLDRPAAVRRNFEIRLGPDGLVKRTIEKPARPRGRLKGVGLYIFGSEILEAAAGTPISPLRGEHELTDSIQSLIDRGSRVAACEAVEWDCNVTTAGDVLACNLRWLDRHGLDASVHPTAVVSPGSRLIRSVLAAGSAVSRPVRVLESVALPGSKIERDLRRCVVGKTCSVEVKSRP